MIWSEIALGEIAEFRNGLNYTKANEGKGIKVINVKDFQDRFYPAYETLDEINPIGIVSEQSILHDGDIIFVRSNGNKDLVGRSIYIDRPEQDISFSGFCIRLRFTDKKLLSKFYAHFFRSPLFRKKLSLLGSGTNISNLNQKVLGGVKVPTPPLHEQRQILSILENYNNLIENNRRRIQLLEESARLLYREWFVHLRFPGHEHVKIVDGVPEGWEKDEIGEFFDTTSGGTPSRKKPDFYLGEINWIKTQELNENYIFDSQEKITEQAVKNSAAKIFPENTLIVSIYGGTNIGRTAILAIPAATNQACVAFFPIHPSANPLFAQLFFQHIRESLIGMAQGAAQTNISQQTLRKVPILMPPPSLMEVFLSHITSLYDQKRTLEFQIIKLQQARDLLLPRLMNGEITVGNIAFN